MEIILGPMFSEKTTTLMSKMHRYAFCKLRCLIIKFANDTRYTSDESIKTHAGILHQNMNETDYKAAINIICATDLNIDISQYDCIGIDEGQFFSDIEVAIKWADNGKKVVISALDGDFKRGIFGKVLNLIPFCDSVVKLKGICMMCHKKDSIFTTKTTTDASQLDIGGIEKYLAVCRDCYNDE